MSAPGVTRQSRLLLACLALAGTKGLTRAGYIMGIIGTIMFALYTLLVVVYFAFIAVIIGMK